MELLWQTIISSAITGAVIAFIGIVYKEIHTDSREIKTWQREKLISTAEEAFDLINSVNTSKAKREYEDEARENYQDYFDSPNADYVFEIYETRLEELGVKEMSPKEKIETIVKMEKSEFIFSVLGSKDLKNRFRDLRQTAQDPKVQSHEIDSYLEKFTDSLKTNLGKPSKLPRHKWSLRQVTEQAEPEE